MTSQTALGDELAATIRKCTGCGACLNKCRFLQLYGLPKTIAETYKPALDFRLPYECSLCGLCDAVCPEGLEPSRLFLAMRRDAAASGRVAFAAYKIILGYEKTGNSPLFTYYGLPQGCDTVFFPGCTFSGTRPRTTRHVFSLLQELIPNLGLVMDCCNKISHDLGRQNHFAAMFNPMRDFLIRHGIRRVLAACPNCYILFKTYGTALQVETIYEHISRNGVPGNPGGHGPVTIHDPCPLRREDDVHNAVRDLAGRMGFSLRESKHKRDRTLCCGEGGSVGFVRGDLADEWRRRRRQEAEELPVLTYCAGCAGFLGRDMRTFHIADALISPRACIDGTAPVARAPFTYLNRLLLKRRFKRELMGAQASVMWQSNAISPRGWK
ncbi:MAG: (Fe-S)-binding protein [Thermodesulfobacteriota bacterium]